MSETTEQAAPKPKRPSRARRREEILAAATRVFGSKGYHQGSLGDVAAQVGITHAGVLHHFGSKDKLLWEVLEYRDRVDVQHLEGKHIPGGLELFRHLAVTARLNAERRGIVQAYAVLTGESVTDGHPASTWVAERFTVLRGEISQAVRDVAAERAVTLPEGEPERAAAAVIAVMDGLQLQWLLDPEAVDLAAATAFAIESILTATLGTTVRITEAAD
ncbi:TetR/AcrR family transcriptional regulator [Promicromonospora thailandica]|uniref:Transcriptional regulator, TetR family n=1 Tax=Promicromonospora thailandica TaxID=765201 RepID=A0A9X2JTZ8_9MICO|nr:TetR/AcrR family transcriptional regulator [Promicromonospora thailandica]MCP2263985.1 transcriptional regulator, TetR family [Promicromonospora thailandica]BFF17681.1 TetR/AcrR family transcriptional regulator [Promicromonospora thailandica]